MYPDCMGAIRLFNGEGKMMGELKAFDEWLDMAHEHWSAEILLAATTCDARHALAELEKVEHAMRLTWEYANRMREGEASD